MRWKSTLRILFITLVVICLSFTSVFGQTTTTTATTTTTKASNVTTTTTKASNVTTTTLASNATTTKASNATAAANGTTTSTTSTTTTTLPLVDLPQDAPTPCNFIQNITDPYLANLLNQRCLNVLSSKAYVSSGSRDITINDQLCGVRNASNNVTIKTSDICYSDQGKGIVTSFTHAIRLSKDFYFSDYADVRNKRFLTRKIQIEKAWNSLYLNSSKMTGFKFERLTIIEMNQPLAPTTLEPPSTTTVATTSRASNASTLAANATTLAANATTTTSATTTTTTNTTTTTTKATNTTTIAPSGRKKRGAYLDQSLDVVAVVQFVGNVAMADYTKVWADLSLNKTNLTSMELDNNFDFVAAMDQCPSLGSLIDVVPSDLWTASNPDVNLNLSVGSSFSFKCPPNLQLSFDNDGFNPFDNLYTVLCNTQQKLQAPFKGTDWPSCVSSCWRRLPPAPSITGLNPVVPPITIPAGSFGNYQCNNSAFGVEAGSSPLFPVQCLNSTKYDIPTTVDGWPICYVKTTTILPVIPVALNSMLERFIKRLEFRFKLNDWKEGDETFVPTPSKPYFSTVTIPAIIVLALIVIIILCCTRLDSPFCSICSDENKEAKKTIVPLEEEHHIQ